MTSRKIASNTAASSRRVSGTRSLDEATNQPESLTKRTFDNGSAAFRGRRPNGRLLYILPIFLLPGLLRTFALGGFFESLAIVLGIVFVLIGAYLVKRGIELDAKIDAKKVTLPSRIPNKAVGAVFYGVGIFLASAFVARFGIGMGLLYGIVTSAAVIVRYGTDRVPEKSEALRKAELSGIDIGHLMKSLDEAKARVVTIRANGNKLANKGFRQQTARIADEAVEVIDQIEQDPRDIRSARKFLISYLKRAEEVTQRYVDKQHLYSADANSGEITAKFAEALNDLETVFQEQNAKLLANDSLDLEVKLDVLSQRLKTEGAG